MDGCSVVTKKLKYQYTVYTKLEDKLFEWVCKSTSAFGTT